MRGESGHEQVIYKTEQLKKTTNPVFKPFSLNIQRLCNGDYDRPLTLKVMDGYDADNLKIMGQIKLVKFHPQTFEIYHLNLNLYYFIFIFHFFFKGLRVKLVPP